MKIKQAIAATGLTDRAIRLYIANDLIHPQDEKSYNGRSSLSFSEEDIALLNKIAILRKAGFSIAQIKAIETDGEQAQTAVNELLEEKQQEQELNGRVIAALMPLKESTTADMDDICGRLWEQMQCREVPKEDMISDSNDRSEKACFFTFAFVIIGAVLLFLWRAFSVQIRFFKFPRFEKSLFNTLLQFGVYFIVPLLLCSIVIILYKKVIVNNKKKRSE